MSVEIIDNAAWLPRGANDIRLSVLIPFYRDDPRPLPRWTPRRVRLGRPLRSWCWTTAAAILSDRRTLQRPSPTCACRAGSFA